jgi:TonB-linked SusC/RagA family outer membrane protein
MRKLLSSLSIALLWATFALAQERTVTGTVTASDDGSALPGVSIKVKGTAAGTQTGAEGQYSIKVQDNSVLVFSFIGFASQEVAVGARIVVNVTMGTDAQQLGEVVVVGYGTQQRRDVTGSISKVQGNEIANLATPSFDRQLAGRATGVQVITPSGLLGQAPQIRIRGTNSISSGTSPLIVVDGVPSVSGNIGGSLQVLGSVSGAGATNVNALADINPTDIESIEVLKDGAATAIYGSRASNGVILVTTKRGRAGATTFNYDSYYATANVSKRFDLLDADQFITIANERLVNAGNTAQAFATPDGNGGFVNTNWQDFVLRRAAQHNHSLSASGGTERTKYFFSLGYSDQKGIVQSNALKRYNFRANLDQNINKIFKFGATAGLSYQDNAGPITNGNAISGLTYGTIRMLPNVPVYDPADPTGYNIAPDRRSLGRGANLTPISDNTPNQRFVLDNNQRQVDAYRLLGSTYLEASILTGLKFRTQLGGDGSYTDDFTRNDPRHGDSFASNGLLSQIYAPFFRVNWQNILSYSKSFNDAHNMDVTLVSELQKERASYFTASAQNISDPFFTENIVSNTFVTPTAFGGLTTKGIESYLARVNYNFRSKYYFGASIRADKLSSLPEATRLGYFPGASVAYRISEEGFFKNSFIAKFISDLRLRASIAEVGNTELSDNFPYLGLYGAAAYGGQSGIAFSNTGNPDLRWESQRTYDAGINMSILDNRFNFTVAYWRKDNKDIILDAPTPPSLGVPGNAISRNIGSVRNNGWEFELGGDVLQKTNFKWNANLTFSTQENKVLELVNGQDILPQHNNASFNIIRVGESMRSIYGYQYEGVNTANGNPLYRKADGTIIQGNINTNAYRGYDPANPGVLGAAATLAATDRRVLGSSLPTWFGGFNNTMTYKNLDMNVFFRFQGGNVIYNRTRADLLNQNFVNNGTEILGRWQSPENPGDGQTPKQYFGRSTFINLDTQASTRFLEKGDFLRLDNVSIGYRLPNPILSRAGLSRVRVYVSGQNLFTATEYSGLDPEVNTNGAGVDYNGTPQQRTFTFGLNLGF